MNYNQAQTYLFEDDEVIPNSKFPLLVYPNVLTERKQSLVDIFEENNWRNTWVGGVFNYHHFHSNSHEVLGVISGQAMIKFGGKQGLNLRVSPGDVVIIPAGVGHKHIESSQDFRVVGAYPNGMSCDLKIGEQAEYKLVRNNISKVPTPSTDPIFGENGPLVEQWT